MNGRIYLAGPEVFLKDAVDIGVAKKRLCAERSYEGLFPFDNEVGGGANVDQVIYRANVEMMRRADFGIFNLTPFRGPSADVGTVFELGLMVGLSKRCFGYTNVPSSLKDRLVAGGAAAYDPHTRDWRDANGMAVEDFGNADNLMIDAALREGGAPLVRAGAVVDEAFRDVRGFVACLDLIEQWLRSSQKAGQAVAG